MNLELKPNKCHIARLETLYLGHIILKYGVSLEPGKTDAVCQFAELKNVKELQAFHGLASNRQNGRADESNPSRNAGETHRILW